MERVRGRDSEIEVPEAICIASHVVSVTSPFRFSGGMLSCDVVYLDMVSLARL